MIKLRLEQGFVEAEAPAQSGYFAGVEVFHHLHCLVRHFALRDWYPERLVPTLPKSNSPAVARPHIDNYIETLRAALTCSAKLTLYQWYKYPDKGDGPVNADFQITHKCKRSDSIAD